MPQRQHHASSVFGPDTLMERLYGLTHNVLDRTDPMPSVVILEGGYGRGKTRAVQRLFDRLAEEDPHGYWRPGLVPRLPPRHETELLASRKRIADPTLCDPTVSPNWLWFGIACSAAFDVQVIGDPAFASFLWQLEQHVQRLLTRLKWPRTARDGMASAAIESVALVAEHYFAPVALVKAAYTVIKKTHAAYSRADADFDAIDMKLVSEQIDSALAALDKLIDANAIPIVVLDDAHRCSPELLSVLARALAKGDPSASPGHLHFESQAPATSRRMMIIATAWSRNESKGPFWRWVDELMTTGVRVEHLNQSDGWFPNIERDSAVAVFSQFVPSLSEEIAGAIVDAGLRFERINPLLLMQYVAIALESRLSVADDIKAWVDALPVSPEDIGKRRFAQMNPGIRDAARLAAALGQEFPLRPLSLALDESAPGIGASSEAMIATMVTDGYIAAASPTDSRRTLMQRSMFVDEADFAYARNNLQHFPWVYSAIDVAIDAWFAELVDYLSADPAHTQITFTFDDIWDDFVVFAPTLGSRSNSARRLAAMQGFRDLMVTSRGKHPDELWSTALRQLYEVSAPAAIIIACKYEVSDPALLRQLWHTAEADFPATRLTQRLASCISDLVECTDLHEAALAALCVSEELFGEARLVASREIARGHTSCAKNLLTYFAKRSDAACLLADVYIHEQDIERAVAVLETVRYSQQGAMRLADIHLRRDDFDAAVKVLSDASNEPHVAIRLSEVLTAAGDRKRAIAVLEGVTEDSSSAIHLAKLYAAEGNVDRAKEVLRPFTERQEVVICLAQLLVMEGQFSDAIEVLSRVCDRANAAIYLASLYRGTGKLDEAAKVLERVSDNAEAAVRLADLYIDKGEIQRATRVLERTADFEPVAIRLANLRWDQGDLDGAIATLERLGHKQSTALRLAELLILKGDPGRAKDVLANVDGELALVRLANLYVDEGKADVAISLLQRFCTNEYVAVRLSELHLIAGDGERAKAILRRVCDKQQPALKLAHLLASDGDFTGAIATIEPWAERYPPAAFALARYATSSTMLERARRLIERQFVDGKAWRHEFGNLCAMSQSADDLLRAIPSSSALMSSLTTFLYDYAATDAHLAGLYAALAEALPRERASAKKFALRHAASDAFCACMLARLPLLEAEAAVIFESLASHAKSGNESARVALGQLAVKRRERKYATLTLKLLSVQEELTTAERVLFEALAPEPKPCFKKVRDVVTRDARTAVWKVDGKRNRAEVPHDV